MARMYFSFDGRTSDEFGILVEDHDFWKLPKRRLEFVQVPGRTGDLIIDDGSRENFTVIFQCHVEVESEDKAMLLAQLDEWLNGPKGYRDLLIFIDGEYQKDLNAIFVGEIALPNTDYFYSDFELEFNCTIIK